jgi:PAS domain S-box-containing protein
LDIFQLERIIYGELNDYTMEKRFIRKDGAIVYASLDVKCVRKPDGEASFIVATIADITEKN